MSTTPDGAVWVGVRAYTTQKLVGFIKVFEKDRDLAVVGGSLHEAAKLALHRLHGADVGEELRGKSKRTGIRGDARMVRGRNGTS